MCIFAILISSALLLFKINMTSIIIYNLVYYIFIQILLFITEIRLFDYSNKPPFNGEFNTEYFIFRELFINLGRVVGNLILLIIGLSHNLEYLKIFFLCTTVALMLIIKLSRDLEKEKL